MLAIAAQAPGRDGVAFKNAWAQSASAGDTLWSGTTGTNAVFARDAALFREGDDAQFCYRIVSGAVRVCRLLPDGRRQLADFLLPGDLLGFDAAGTYSFTAEAIVETVATRYPRRGLDEMAQANVRLSGFLLNIMCERLSAAQNQILLLGRKNAAEKLASFILGLAERTGHDGSADDPLDLAMTRTDIADYLGLTIETVSRTFAIFRRNGMIDLPRTQSVVFTDRDALAELAEGDTAI
jgi:CRP-like cAMP-binding protein